MCDSQMHNEALRRQRFLERKAMANRRMDELQVNVDEKPFEANHNDCFGAPLVDQARGLPKYQVHDAYTDNRYASVKKPMNPYVDRIYPIMYPDGTNTDYTKDIDRNDRRLNKAWSSYKARRAHAVPMDLKVNVDVMPSSIHKDD